MCDNLNIIALCRSECASHRNGQEHRLFHSYWLNEGRNGTEVKFPWPPQADLHQHCFPGYGFLLLEYDAKEVLTALPYYALDSVSNKSDSGCDRKSNPAPDEIRRGPYGNAHMLRKNFPLARLGHGSEPAQGPRRNSQETRCAETSSHFGNSMSQR
jgi:hypothetical protein